MQHRPHMLLLQGFQIAAGLRTVLQREAGEKIRQWNQRKRRHGREGGGEVLQIIARVEPQKCA